MNEVLPSDLNRQQRRKATKNSKQIEELAKQVEERVKSNMEAEETKEDQEAKASKFGENLGAKATEIGIGVLLAPVVATAIISEGLGFFSGANIKAFTEGMRQGSRMIIVKRGY